MTTGPRLVSPVQAHVVATRFQVASTRDRINPVGACAGSHGIPPGFLERPSAPHPRVHRHRATRPRNIRCPPPGNPRGGSGVLPPRYLVADQRFPKRSEGETYRIDDPGGQRACGHRRPSVQRRAGQDSRIGGCSRPGVDRDGHRPVGVRKGSSQGPHHRRCGDD